MTDAELKPGSRWQSVVCDTQVIVVRPPTTGVVLQCGGHPMVPVGVEVPAGLTLDPAFAEPTADRQALRRRGDRVGGAGHEGWRGHARPRRHQDPAQGRQAAARVGLILQEITRRSP